MSKPSPVEKQRLSLDLPRVVKDQIIDETMQERKRTGSSVDYWETISRWAADRNPETAKVLSDAKILNG